jgi:hypothetical protein
VVSINFYPNRKKMSREIGLCIVLKRRDVLESFCGSCIFRTFENREARECSSCEVRRALNVIRQENKKTTTPADRVSVERTAARADLVPDRKELRSDNVDFLGRLMTYSKTLLSAMLLCLFLFGDTSVALAATPSDAAIRSMPAGNSLSDVAKILSVLEGRTTDRTVLGKAAEKLSAMEGRRLRLLSSLCDRISQDPRTAGADIAFSLMTVMIVMS